MSAGAIAGLAAGVSIAGIIIGIIIGFVIGQRYLKKQLKENPIITKDQIRDLLTQCGQHPNEARVNQI
ncbi:MAG: YneF family protein [Mycoplasmoidaceae bacterium]|nr:YneF family protein [Mycoplasmoidaceae bacterium]